MANRLKLPPDEPECLRITPLPLKNDFDADSVDLRLGSHFFIPVGHKSPFYCPGETDPEWLYQEQYVPIGEYIVIPAHNTVLGATLEFIKLPFNMSGQVLTKSSWARSFVTVGTAPWIHPLYRGCLTLEIANVSNTPIVIYPGHKIAQLILLHCSGIEKIAEEEIKDEQVGPTRPECSTVPSAVEALKVFGVLPERILHVYDEYEELIKQDPKHGKKAQAPTGQ
jgi:dCTP deaminase